MPAQRRRPGPRWRAASWQRGRRPWPQPPAVSLPCLPCLPCLRCLQRRPGLACRPGLVWLHRRPCLAWLHRRPCLACRPGLRPSLRLCRRRTWCAVLPPEASSRMLSLRPAPGGQSQTRRLDPSPPAASSPRREGSAHNAREGGVRNPLLVASRLNGSVGSGADFAYCPADLPIGFQLAHRASNCPSGYDLPSGPARQVGSR